MIRKLVLVVLFTFFPIFFGGAAQAVPVALNDFSNGLNGWSAQDVVVNNGIAEMNDSNGYSLLYTGVKVTPGSTYSLSFDFATGVNGVNGWIFSDLLATTIYIGPSNNFDYSLMPIYLFDNNAGTPLIYNGAITPIPGKADWFHFNNTFTATDSWLFPTFELFDYNQQVDGIAYIYNISLDQAMSVPEPSTFLLLAGGILGLWGFRLRMKTF